MRMRIRLSPGPGSRRRCRSWCRNAPCHVDGPSGTGRSAATARRRRRSAAATAPSAASEATGAHRPAHAGGPGRHAAAGVARAGGRPGRRSAAGVPRRVVIADRLERRRSVTRRRPGGLRSAVAFAGVAKGRACAVATQTAWSANQRVPVSASGTYAARTVPPPCDLRRPCAAGSSGSATGRVSSSPSSHTSPAVAGPSTARSQTASRPVMAPGSTRSTRPCRSRRRTPPDVLSSTKASRSSGRSARRST